MLQFLILLFPVIITLFGALAILLQTGKHYAQKIMMIGLFDMAISYYFYALYYDCNYEFFYIFDIFYALFLLILHPILLLYFRALTESRRFIWFDISIFLPAVIMTLALASGYMLLGNDLSVQASRYLYYGHKSEVIDTSSIGFNLVKTFGVDLFIFVLLGQMLVFLFYSAYSLRKHSRLVNKYYPEYSSEESRYIRLFWIVMMLFNVYNIICCVVPRKSLLDYPLLVDSMFILHGIFCLICIYLTQKIRFDGADFVSSEVHTLSIQSKKDLSDDGDLESKLARWMMSPNKLFLKEGLTINDVACDIGVSKRSLSKYINTRYDANFNAFVNSKRVDEAIRIIKEEGRELTLTEISYRTGFSNLPAMSRAFKKIKGVSPTYYKETDN